ncbi:MAG: endonuclease domain-containing protein [Porphyromonadaceae bacterium]|jgi:very-short-patch-repair endonuclease|nr:endonuclease domain-containing protein [Porphyromonadaceae bacterium]
MKLYNKKNSQENRRKLRKKMTPAEIALWTMLQKKQLDGVRFLRQYSIGAYIVDFYSPKYHLAVELDGEYHFDEQRIQYDKKRTAFLNEKGIRVLRFENFEVFDYPQRTLDEIRRFLYSNENPENLLLY